MAPQVWATLQTLVLHTVFCAAQSPARRHGTHVPLPSQTFPPLSLQVVPAFAFVVPQQPALQTSTTHAVAVAAHCVAVVHAIAPSHASCPESGRTVASRTVASRTVASRTVARCTVTGCAIATGRAVRPIELSTAASFAAPSSPGAPSVPASEAEVLSATAPSAAPSVSTLASSPVGISRAIEGCGDERSPWRRGRTGS